jgi:hypothetical protein
MDDAAGFIGDLLCAIPMGIDECSSRSGMALLGSWVVIGALGAAASFFLFRRSRRWGGRA